MDTGNSSDSDCELVIDETIIVSSEEDEECIDRFNKAEKSLSSEESNWSNEGLYKNLFHPESISSADMKDELFIEETNTCNVCNESFKYNVGLIYHMEMEHKEDLKVAIKKKSKIAKRISKTDKKIMSYDSRTSGNENKLSNYSDKEMLRKVCIAGVNAENLKATSPAVFKKSCEICKKSFTDQNKMTKHVEGCLKIGLKFQCMYCKSKFGWESKYKKHLFRTHKLNAAVICKSCSSVFSDMASLAVHSRQCQNKQNANITLGLIDDMEW